jgi:hypothetical protein
MVASRSRFDLPSSSRYAFAYISLMGTSLCKMLGLPWDGGHGKRVHTLVRRRLVSRSNIPPAVIDAGDSAAKHSARKNARFPVPLATKNTRQDAPRPSTRVEPFRDRQPARMKRITQQDFGDTGGLWASARVAHLIESDCGVRYHPGHAWPVCGNWVGVPATHGRARERDN